MSRSSDSACCDRVQGEQDDGYVTLLLRALRDENMDLAKQLIEKREDINTPSKHVRKISRRDLL